MNKIVNIFAGLLLGALVGMGLALLFAPESGTEIRRRIEEWADEVRAVGQQAAEQKRLELTAQLEELRHA